MLSVHDLSFFLNPLWFTKRSRLWHQWFQPRHLIEYAAHIVAPSETTTQDILHFFGKDTDQITTIPHPMDPAFSEKRQPQDDGIRSKYRLPKKFLLHVGTWEPRKNIDGLLAALSAEQMPIVFVGSRGNAKSVPESARPLVRVLNYVPQEDLPSIYRSATALIFPSFYEGYGLPIVEAFASGTPVVTSAHSATREVAGDAAILIDPRRPNEIATAIHTIVNNNPLRRGLIASGLKRAHTLSRNHSGRALYQALKASATQNS